MISTLYELADLGVTVVPVKSQTGPITSAMGKMLCAIQAWYAEIENSERSEAIKAGQARARAVLLPRRGLEYPHRSVSEPRISLDALLFESNLRGRPCGTRRPFP